MEVRGKENAIEIILKTDSSYKRRIHINPLPNEIFSYRILSIVNRNLAAPVIFSAVRMRSPLCVCLHSPCPISGLCVRPVFRLCNIFTQMTLREIIAVQFVCKSGIDIGQNTERMSHFRFMAGQHGSSLEKRLHHNNHAAQVLPNTF